MITDDKFMPCPASVIEEMARALSTERDDTCGAHLERLASDLRTKWSRAFPRMPVQAIDKSVAGLVDRVRCGAK